MFPSLQRYDPRAEDRKKKRSSRPEIDGRSNKPRKKKQQKEKSTHERNEIKDEQDNIKSKVSPPPTLHVIAEESVPVSSAKKTLLDTDEAFDDFDIEEELLEEQNGDEKSSKKENSTLPEKTGNVVLSDEIQTALHMSSLPIDTAASTWSLAPFLIENLRRDGYENFFPIQALVIPDVIATERNAHIRARDLCVAAPTGSGKTLAFVLPVLNALAQRKIQRLRALVVLPSRDLATQVHEVFDRYTRGSDLCVGLAIGQSDFEAEQKALTVGPRDFGGIFDLNLARHRYSLDEGNLSLALEAFPAQGVSEMAASEKLEIPEGGRSAVDILVATPGRLIDHLDRTPGFTLQHLRFLVIDEADRLVIQSYHNWIKRVVDSANSVSANARHRIATMHDGKEPPLERSHDLNSFVIDPITWRRGGIEGDHYASDSTLLAESIYRPVQLRKMLFSATLTRDPQKLAALGLVNPKHFDAHTLQSDGGHGRPQRYSMPKSLSEYTVECTAEQKPLVLLALLLEHLGKETPAGSDRNIMVVFTSSLDSTHRLARLLQLLWASAGFGNADSVVEFSSALNQSQRTTLMKRCASSNSVSVLVCSDGMSRGMDIPGVNVINYDVPSFAKTYVHRCGRTARAGKAGIAITLLKGGQTSQFTRMRRIIDDPGRVLDIGVKKELVRDAVAVYRSCVKALRGVLQAEQDGDLGTTETIPDSLAPER